VGTALTWLKNACVIAAALSGLALVHSTGTVSWWPASFLALGLLIFLGAADQAVASVAQRYPRRSSAWWLSLWQLSPGPAETKATGAGDHFGDGLQEEHPGARPPAPDEQLITEEELISLDQRDRDMFRSILRLDVATAREIMVPRLDMVTVDADATVVEVADLMIRGGHSRLPVYEETIDRILGIVHSREVMAALARPNPETTLRSLVRPPYIIPETKRLDDLLEELQDRGVHMAVVVDEYGGTEGLVTMEDVLEEIVGEIEDEFSRTREAQVVHLSDGAVLVDAGMAIEDVEELFATRIGTADVDTVGGYVYQALGKIPQFGDVVTTDHLRIEVVSILGRRLRKLRIKRIDPDGLDGVA
jgi:CBS domain containing-hemolysin-like protein